MRENYMDFITKAQRESNIHIKHFFNLLGLDVNLFNHLYNIQIILGSKNQYDIESNAISININGVNDIMREIEHTNSLKEKENLLLNMCVTIVHETIHANRSIIIENGLSISKIKEIIDNSKIRNPRILENGSERYNEIIEYSMNNSNFKLFKRYIPLSIKASTEKNNVIAYDKDEKNIVVFDQIENIDYKNSDELLYKIGTIINKNIKNGNIKKKTTNSLVACDYYTGDEKLDKNSIDKIMDIIYCNGLEEAFTETIAILIICSRNCDKLDFDLLMEKVEKNAYTEDIKLIVNLIKNTGIEIIKWFMTSVYEDVYINEFERLFNEDYHEFLKSFEIIYNKQIMDETEPDRLVLSKAKSMINKIK